MANTALALKWLNDNRSRYGFRIRKMSWPHDFLKINLFDYEISLEYEGKVHTGRGLDLDEPTAVVKALAESLERLCSYKHGITSSGVSTHLIWHLAH